MPEIRHLQNRRNKKYPKSEIIISEKSFTYYNDNDNTVITKRGLPKFLGE